MRALITGAGGQVATELLAKAPQGWSVAALSRADLDIRDESAINRVLQAQRPDLLINAAAYVAVDKAESDVETATAVNCDAVGALGAAASAIGARFTHISTDFVFDGAASRPYLADSPTAPQGVYGATKLAGELRLAEVCPSALIVRTAWVYSPYSANFLKTMLRVMAERGEVRVVDDQVGTPTAADGLAQALWDLSLAGAQGVHHFTDAGVASWYDFAQAIAEEAVSAGLLSSAPRVFPIPTSAYPTPARRPAFSVLDKRATWEALGWSSRHWRAALREVVARLAAAQNT